ncbi:MAG: ABC transporter substrate-binding protein [Thiolinea sp.]
MLKSWQTSADGLTYTLTLRDDLLWSDGSRFIADDLATAIRYQFQHTEGGITSKIYGQVALKPVNAPAEQTSTATERINQEPDIAAPDPQTLIIQLRRPDPLFMERLVMINATALKAEQLERYGEDWHDPDHLLTLSPFRIREAQLPESLVLEKYPDFPGADGLYWDTLQIRFIPRIEQRLRALQNDEVDVIRVDELTNSIGNSQQLPGTMLLAERPNTRFISLNPQRELFKQARLREALSLLIDPLTLVPSESQLEAPLHTIIPAGVDPNYQGPEVKAAGSRDERFERAGGCWLIWASHRNNPER